jgi:hypothetical protein
MVVGAALRAVRDLSWEAASGTLKGVRVVRRTPVRQPLKLKRPPMPPPLAYLSFNGHGADHFGRAWAVNGGPQEVPAA